MLSYIENVLPPSRPEPRTGPKKRTFLSCRQVDEPKKVEFCADLEQSAYKSRIIPKCNFSRAFNISLLCFQNQPKRIADSVPTICITCCRNAWAQPIFAMPE